jgi:hypothetical protein
MRYKVGTENTSVIEDHGPTDDPNHRGQAEVIPVGLQHAVDVDGDEAVCGFPRERLTVFNADWETVPGQKCQACEVILKHEAPQP